MPFGIPTSRSRAGRRSRSRGQSLVEAAITLPVVLLLGLGVTDIGRAFYYREAVTNATRQALRLAVSPTQQATANTVCASAGVGPVASHGDHHAATRRDFDHQHRQPRLAREFQQRHPRRFRDLRRNSQPSPFTAWAARA